MILSTIIRTIERRFPGTPTITTDRLDEMLKEDQGRRGRKATGGLHA